MKALLPDIDLANSGPGCDAANVGIDAIVERVERERQNWHNFFGKPSPAEEKVDAEKGTYRVSVEQQSYLDQGPDLQNFICGFGTFMSDACVFMAETEQMQERCEDLKDRCQFRINTMQRNKAAEALAGTKDKQ